MLKKKSIDRKSSQERILCFRGNILSTYSVSHRKIFYDEKLWEHILHNLEIVPRLEAEEKFDCKQLVAYVLIEADGFYLTYRRTRRSFEEKLRRKHSLGIGGHINLGDRNQSELTNIHVNHKMKMDFILRGVWRELKEEISIKSAIGEPKLLCFINDDSNEVGLRHFGIVWLLQIEKPDVAKKGTGVGRIEFHNIDYLKRNQSIFERWSQLLIEFLAKS